jgi:hypothetical protein
MEIKDLKALLKLLRASGVLTYKTPELELTLSAEHLPQEQTTSGPQEEIPTENPYASFPSGILSPSQLAFYSAGGDPDADPENVQ